MKISQQFCFTHSSGEDIYLFTLGNATGTEVTITNYGAIITSFKITANDGKLNDIVLGFENPSGYLAAGYLENYPWFGAVIGRYANRIKKGEFELDGKKYFLSKNRNDDHLHGGTTGFDKKVWQLMSLGESPCPFLELKYISPDGEEGFPGNLETVIRFELRNGNELSYAFTAVSDKPTPVNLTHHSYFNLNNGQGTIEAHEVRIPASTMLEQDGQLVATGRELPVANTAFDFREFHAIGERLPQVEEYDKSFVVDQPQNSLVAEARSVQSGLLLQVFSTEPVLHFYSGKWIPAIKGKYGNCYGPLSGFCLETHKHPNAVNIPHFPDTVLRPGETYYQKTTYKVVS